MTPATILRDAQADGVMLALSPSGNIKATGDRVAVNRWLSMIREHKAAIIDVLKVRTGDTTAVPMSAKEETAIRAWLAQIEETDPATIAGVIEQSQRDAEARNYFIGRAADLSNQNEGE